MQEVDLSPASSIYASSLRPSCFHRSTRVVLPTALFLALSMHRSWSKVMLCREASFLPFSIGSLSSELSEVTLRLSSLAMFLLCTAVGMTDEKKDFIAMLCILHFTDSHTLTLVRRARADEWQLLRRLCLLLQRMSRQHRHR